MIPLKVHNVLDYIVGVILLIVPWVFGFDDIDVARNVMLFGGAVLIIYSLLTNYYYSAARIIPLGAHMTLDVILGVYLLLAPMLFGYRDVLSNGQYAVHIVLGIIAVGMVALTRPRTESGKTPAEKEALGRDVPLPTT